nr:outer membrane beta-barrel protein [Pedobacter sp. ASV2]
MKIKKICYFICFICSICKVNAQIIIGADAGVSYNKLDYKMNNGKLKLENNQGYMASINVDYGLNKQFSLESSPGIIQKNYLIKNQNGIYQQNNNTYLQLPFNIKYHVKIVKRLYTSASLGAYYAYWLSSTLKGIIPNVFELSNDAEGNEVFKQQSFKYVYQFDPSKDNRSEFGWTGKIELNYEILKKLSGSIKARYYQSITDQQKKIVEGQVARYNQTFGITMGVGYHI